MLFTYDDVAKIFHCAEHPERVPTSLDRHKITRRADNLLTEDMLKALGQCNTSIELDADDESSAS